MRIKGKKIDHRNDFLGGGDITCILPEAGQNSAHQWIIATSCNWKTGKGKHSEKRAEKGHRDPVVRSCNVLLRGGERCLLR